MSVFLSVRSSLGRPELKSVLFDRFLKQKRFSFSNEENRCVNPLEGSRSMMTRMMTFGTWNINAQFLCEIQILSSLTSTTFSILPIPPPLFSMKKIIALLLLPLTTSFAPSHAFKRQNLMKSFAGVGDQEGVQFGGNTWTPDAGKVTKLFNAQYRNPNIITLTFSSFDRRR